MTTAIRSRRVAFYRRTATSEGDEAYQQLDHLTRWLGREPGAVLVRDYLDEGVSGRLQMSQRPQGEELLEAAAEDTFDELWITEPSRLSRETLDLISVMSTLDHAGVRLVILDTLHPFVGSAKKDGDM